MKKDPSILGTSFSVLLAFLCFLQKTKAVPVSSEFAKPQPCLNETYIHPINRVVNAMDVSVDPCDDFYAYSCNGWIKNNPISIEQSEKSIIFNIDDQNYEWIKRFLDQPKDIFVSKAERKVKDYYDSCVDHYENREALGAKPMLELLEELGGWNVSTNNFAITSWSFQNTLKAIHNEHGINALFGYKVLKNRQSDRYAIYVQPGTLIFPKTIYSNETKYKQVAETSLDYMTNVGILLGGNDKDTKYQMKAVLKFDSELANILIEDAETIVNFHDTTRTIDELRTGVDFIDWQSFFEDAVESVPRVTPKEQFIVSNPDYLEKLTLLLKKYNETEERRVVLNNYLIWRIVNEYMPFLSKDFSDIHQNFAEIANLEVVKRDPEWMCIDSIIDKFEYVAAAILVWKDLSVKSNVEKLLKGIKSAFKTNLKNLQWLDEETRKAVEIKVDAVSELIGYPDSILNTTFLDEEYGHIKLQEGAYFQNIINFNYYKLKKDLEMVNKPVNQPVKRYNLLYLYARYTYAINRMVVPIAILQSPIYDSNQPANLNFGSIGTILGHELTHGFDDSGKDFDENGNDQHWSNHTIKLFHNRTECLVKQYSQYEFNGKHVDGVFTLNENIADNGGLKAAYHAYLEYAKNEPEPPPLPELNLNHKQLFFVAFAQTWCSNRTPEKTDGLMRDIHAIDKYRVIGTLSNSNEFSEEFKCPVGSRMNPKEKCEVW